MLQLVYISSMHGEPEIDRILVTSRRNNAIDGITGLLFTDGVRFLQALEGPNEKVEAAFERILADNRHRAVVILSNRMVEERAFGDWAMAHRAPGQDSAQLMAVIKPHLVSASANIRATFESFASINRAVTPFDPLLSRLVG